LGLAFFGLTFDIIAEARAAVFKQIHEICFHGQGGYQWETVYNMPIWLRKFTFHQIQQYHNDQNERQDSQSEKGESTLIDSSGKVNTPNFKEASKDYKRPSSYK
tara:strand:- start:915 stop:1226 length:312 start_codon:yes stop_codon:yes gene_type:complete